MRAGRSRSSGKRGLLLPLWLALLGASLGLSPALAQICPAETVAAPRLTEPWWAARHAGILSQIGRHPDPEVVLMGDSITHNYDKSKLPDENFRPTWDRFYAPRRALNLGFSGDTTANLLWRLRNGEIDGIAPKAVVALIGTNDTARNAEPAQVLCGIDAIVRELERRLPAARILLLGILPSDISGTKSSADRTVNAELASRYSEDARVTYLDIGPAFLGTAGKLDTAIFYDPRLTDRHAKALHPDTIGQRRMAEAVEPALARLLSTPPAVPLAAMTDVNTAVIPVPRLERDFYDWYARHHEVLALARTSRPEVVLIGDSITHMWAGNPASVRRNGPIAWQQLFGTSKVLNLGFGWDRIQNVLWRLRAGELDGLSPREVIINIGTNNLTGTANARANTPSEIVAGISAIIAEVQQKAPSSRITLMGIFPRGALPGDPHRQPILETNRLLAERYRHDPKVRFLDIGAQFLAPDGAMRPGLMLDGTHPSEAGYAVWARALKRAGLRLRTDAHDIMTREPRTMDTQPLSRRRLITNGLALAGTTLVRPAWAAGSKDPNAWLRTPYKYNKLVLAGSKVPGSFDEKAVDCPFVFFHDGRFYLTYVGFDGTGYQTGIAVSDDLVNWERQGIILARDPNDPVTRYNVAAASILRENELYSPGRLIKVDGQYVCAWHAYPSAGYEQGAAVIGLAFSTDLKTWRRGPPILRPEEGADWERGGLYKPYLVKHRDTFYLYYNAKNAEKRWHEQTGVATSRDLKSWTRHAGNPLLRNGPAGSPDARFASDPFVVTHRGKWAMFYFGLADNGKARDLVAVGSDPLNFTKVDEVLIDVGPRGSIDDDYAHKPALVYHKGDLYHFYCAVGGPYPNEVRGLSVTRSRPWG